MPSKYFDKVFVSKFKQFSRKMYDIGIGHSRAGGVLVNSSSQWKNSFHCLRQHYHVKTNVKNNSFKMKVIDSIPKSNYIDVSPWSSI